MRCCLHIQGDQRKPHALALASLSSLRWEVLGIFFPKLCYISLSLCQPFLIQKAVRFVQTPNSVGSNDMGYGLVGAFALVFTGLAVSKPDDCPHLSSLLIDQLRLR